MTQGIIYGLTGPSHAELFAVSLWSLRQHYGGPVTLFVTPCCQELGETICADARLECSLAKTMRLDDNPRPHWITKAMLYLQSPYDHTIYLDGDTIILADPSPMFDDRITMAVTRCRGEKLRLKSDHQYPISLRKQVQKMRGYGPIMSGMVERAEDANVYAQNNGVLAFPRNHPALWEIHHLSVGFRRERLHDELATQLVLPRHQDTIRYVGGEWNALAKYEDRWDRAKIVHLANGSHLKDWRGWGGHRGVDLWLHWLRSAWEADAGGLQRWCGDGDPAVKSQMTWA